MKILNPKLMRHVVLALFVGVVTNSYCQLLTIDDLPKNDSAFLEFQNLTDFWFENLDFSYVPSGNLYERGVPYFNINPFDGTLVDSSKSNQMAFYLAFATMSSMDVDENLPLPDEYKNKTIGQTNNSDTILIMGMHQEYHKIDPDAFSNNLLEVNGGQIIDVFPRNQSPYIHHDLFLFAPAVHKVQKLNFKFLLDSDLFYSNSNKIVQSVEIDLDDGNDFRTCNFDAPVICNYPNEGVKTIRVKINYTDGSVYASHFDFIVEEAQNRNGDQLWDDFHYIPPIGNGQTDAGRGGGKVYVYYACGHDEIEKPFIWAEAFNPSFNLNGSDVSLKPQDIIDRMSTAQTEFPQNSGLLLWNNLINEGYDIIILDYDNGVDFLPRTSEFVKEALRWINQQKENAGSNEKNILLGQSMGGVVSNVALKEMELDLEDHEVGTFIIFDSPIMGVNIPLCTQHSLIDIANLPVNMPELPGQGQGLGGGYVPLYEYFPVLEEAVNILLSPAARTMTRYSVIPSQLSQYHLWNDYYEYQHQTLNGGPEKCEVLTITNGSRFGSSGKQPFNAGDLIVKAAPNTITAVAILGNLAFNGLLAGDSYLIDGNASFVEKLLLFFEVGGELFTDINLFAVADHNSSVVYSSTIYFDGVLAQILNFGQPVIIHQNVAIGPSIPPIDNAPGGFFTGSDQGLFISNSNLNPVLHPDVFKLHTYCFTPTFSVLNYHEDPQSNEFINVNRSFTNNTADIANNDTRNVDNYLSNSTMPTFGTSDSYNNTAHTWFTGESTEFLIYHLIGTDQLNGLNQLVNWDYNYGKAELAPNINYQNSIPIMTKSVLSHSLLVDGKTLGVNRDVKIGSTAQPPPFANPFLSPPNSSFLMTIGTVCEGENIELTVQNGGKFILGDGIERTGACHLTSNNVIRIKDGGELIINEGSTVKLRHYSKLIIEDGGKVYIHNNAQLITETASEIEFHDGAEIHILGDDAKLVMEGTLHLMPNALFRPLHANAPSGQIVVRSPIGWLEAEQGSRVQIFGDNSNDLFFVIEHLGKVIVPSEIQNIIFSNCKVLSNSGSNTIPVIQTYAPMYASGTTFETGHGAVANQIHPIIHANEFIRFSNCELYDHRIVGSFYFNGNLQMFNSDMNYSYAKSFPMVDVYSGGVTMSQNNFNDYSFKCINTSSLILPSSISNSDFNPNNGASSYGVYDVSDIELRMNANVFTDNYTPILKQSGKLTVRCNEFINSFAALDIRDNCWLESSVFGFGGYNIFNNAQAYNILFQNAIYPSVNEAYNTFDASSSGYIFKGSIQIPSGYNNYLDVQKSEWTGVVNIPFQSQFQVTSTIGASVTMGLSQPENATCGFYDPPLPSPIGPPSWNGAQKVKTPSFNNVKLIDAVEYAVSYSESRDSLKDDLISLSLLNEILTYDINNPNKHTKFLQMYATEYMSNIMHNTFLTGKICREDNQTCFHSGVQDYVDVLNYRTQEDVDADNYKEQFRMEMDKAHLFYMLGRTDLALSFLYNMESCGLDFDEQKQVNDWKYIWESEVAKISYGADADLKDTLWVDTNYYFAPTQQTPGNFGSEIINEKTVVFLDCGNSKSPFNNKGENNEISFSVYPNPSDGDINASYTLPKGSSGIIVIYDLEGRQLMNFKCYEGHQSLKVDLSGLSSGTYLVEYVIDGIEQKAVRVVRH